MFRYLYDNIKYYSSKLLYKIGIWDLDGKILVLGLDNSGKTTFLNLLKTNKLKQLIPTSHPNMEKLKIGKINFTIFDLGGHNSVRRLWTDYFIDIDSIIFMIDAFDKERISEASQELNKLLCNKYLDTIPILIYGNKIDNPSAFSKEQMIYHLNISDEINQDRINLVMCSIVKKFGISEGFQWIESKIKSKRI